MDRIELNFKDTQLLADELFKAGNLEDALSAYRALAEEDGKNWHAAFHTGFMLSALKRYEEALPWYDHACAVAVTELNMTTLNRAQSLGEMGRSAEALYMLNALIRSQPNYAHAYYNRGVIKLQMDDFEGSLADFGRCLELDPTTADGDARFCRGFANLVLGDYAAGFRDFEHRLKDNVRGGPAQGVELRLEHVFSQTMEPGFRIIPPAVCGKTVLVLSEMGRGDMIQFGRYLPKLVDRGANVLVVADRGTEPLFRGMFGVTVFAPTDVLPAADYWCHMMGLAHVFGTTRDTVPEPMTLAYDPALLAEWRNLIPRDGVMNVGLCWAGSPISRYDEHRTIPLEMLEPLVNIGRPVRFFGLQQEIRDRDKAAYWDLDIKHIGQGFTDFRQTAHAMKCLDLVITVDTSVAHMAGTVGVPTWVLLTKFRTYWLWIKGMTTTPWYPTFELFRQKADGDWPEVIGIVADKLKNLLIE